MTDEAKKLFVAAMETLLYSWGSDTPPEAIWAGNEFIKFYEKETGKKIAGKLKEDGNDHVKIIELLKRS